MQEADKVHAVLRYYMHTALHLDDETIDDVLAKKLFPHSTLYGASRWPADMQCDVRTCA